jgi:hypothetical protein
MKGDPAFAEISRKLSINSGAPPVKMASLSKRSVDLSASGGSRYRGLWHGFNPNFFEKLRLSFENRGQKGVKPGHKAYLSVQRMDRR